MAAKHQLRGKFLMLSVIILAATAWLWLDYSHRPAAFSQAEQGISAAPVPNITFMALGMAQPMQLHQLNGSVVLINFWASWCVPCVEEMPRLLAFAHENPSKVKLLLISVDSTAEAMQGFLEKQIREHSLPAQLLKQPGSNIYAVWDADKSISQDVFQTIRYPETLWLRPDLTVQEKIIGTVTPQKLKQIQATLPR